MDKVGMGTPQNLSQPVHHKCWGSMSKSAQSLLVHLLKEGVLHHVGWAGQRADHTKERAGPQPEKQTKGSNLVASTEITPEENSIKPR